MTRAARLLIATTLLVATGCTQAADLGAGCAAYGTQRASMPRPLPDDALGRWVAITDAALTGACR